MTEHVTVVSTNITPHPVIPARNIPAVPLSLVDLGKRLLDASKRGDTMEIRTLMSSGAPFTTDWLGTSPLHFAAMHGHIDTVTILMRAGISRDARTKVDRTPLHVAAQNGHFEVVQILLKNSAIIDACDMLRMTPLHWAVENGHTNVVNLLLKHDASTRHIDKFDRTPMDIALSRMQMDIVQLLQAALSMQTRPISNPDTMIEEEVLTTESTEQILSADESETLTTDDRTEAITDSGNSTGGSNTSVLTALAALAEATASNSASNGSDGSNWLSSKGVTVSTRSDADPPLALTEAGKLALTNFMKEQGDGSTVMTLVDQDGNEVLFVQQPEDVAAESAASQDATSNDLHIDISKAGEEPMTAEAAD